MRAPLDIMEGWLNSEEVGPAEIPRKSPAVLSYNDFARRPVKSTGLLVNPATEKVDMGRGKPQMFGKDFSIHHGVK